jgi:outer membrane protein OmpA-like peptidoglycan-associated protein/tetratricopeptide (TPR) repeat protein
MKPFVIIFFIAFGLVSNNVWAQKGDLKKADSFIQKGEFFKALEVYKLAENSGVKFDLETKKKVARCYYELNNVDKAFELYTDIADYLTGNDVFLYASTTHRFGFYEGAIELYEQALKNGENPVLVNELIKGCQWAMENEILVPNVLVNPSTMVSFGQSFGIQYYRNGVVYSSALEGKGGKNVDKQGMSFLNLFYSDLENGQIKEGKRLFSENLVFPFHVGAIAFTSDYNTMYFTRSVLVKGRDLFKIFMVEYNGKEWSKPIELSINSNDYDCAMPAVSPDNKLLYFVSNKKTDSYGGKDIFVCEIKGKNSFGEVRNIGSDVNTFGDEVFPIISKENVLYFSSDTHYGFGGLDIFSAEFVNNKWTNVKNLLKPYNSNYDDFGYVIDPNDNAKGFLSSRNFGNRDADIIFYISPRPEDKSKASDEERIIAGLDMVKKDGETVVEPVKDIPVETGLPQQVSSVLTSSFNGTAVGGATVVLRETTTGTIIGEAVSDATGKFVIDIPEAYRTADAEFEIEVSKGNEFKPKKVIVNIQEFDDFKKSGISLTPIFNDVVLDDMSDMVIPYVDNEITKDGLAVLDRLAAYLLNNPHVVIKLNGHTEARGNRFINLTVSQQVAEKCELYLISKGVPDENIIPRGYAERYLLNKCKRGKYCTESEHLANRRVEVVVWRFLNQ